MVIIKLKFHGICSGSRIGFPCPSSTCTPLPKDLQSTLWVNATKRPFIVRALLNLDINLIYQLS